VKNKQAPRRIIAAVVKAIHSKRRAVRKRGMGVTRYWHT